MGYVCLFFGMGRGGATGTFYESHALRRKSRSRRKDDSVGALTRRPPRLCILLGCREMKSEGF